uniref:Uncharacterized protein n=1 Tax=Vitis vinifera TaxID=29760 RepID=A5AF32_VITVI|nr:hypothetical protein VITISV_024810 [Vitis vinifera]
MACQLSIRVLSGGHTTLSNPLPGQCSPLSGYVVRTYEALVVKCEPSHFRQPITACIRPPAKQKNGDDGKSSPMISDSRLQSDDDFAMA